MKELTRKEAIKLLGKIKDKIHPKCLIFIICMLGIVLDMFVNCGVLPSNCLISVSENYIYYTYESIISISILSYSIIALITGLLPKEYYGYSTQEILGFPSAKIKMSEYITLSLINAGSATIIIFFESKVSVANSITCLLFSALLLVGYMSRKIIKIILSDQYCQDLVKDRYKKFVNDTNVDISTYKTLISRLTRALTDAIKDKDAESKNEIVNLIITLNNGFASKDYSVNAFSYFSDIMQELVKKFSIQFGFTDMLESTVSMCEPFANTRDSIDYELSIIPIDDEKYWKDEDFSRKNNLKYILDLHKIKLYQENKITNEFIYKCFLHYFNAIIENQYCTEHLKKYLINEFFKETTLFKKFEKTSYAPPDYAAVLDLVLKYIIYQNDKKMKELTFHALAANLYYNIKYIPEKYFNFLSNLFQLFYFAIYYETETLSETARSELKNMIQTPASNIYLHNYTIIDLLKQNIAGILRALAAEIQTDNIFRREHFAPYMISKTAIWTTENVIRYFMVLYAVFYTELIFDEFFSLFTDWTSTENKTRYKILTHVLNLFDNQTGTFKYTVMKEIEEASAFYEYTSTLSPERQTILFQKLNEVQRETAEAYELDNSDINLTVSDIAEEVKNLLQSDRIYGLSLNTHTDTYIKCRVAPNICKRSWARSALSNQIRYSIIEEMNKFLKRNARTLKLSFDEDGLQTLSSFLENSVYTHRNYTFSNDWSLSQYQKSDIYLKVCKQNDSTLLVKTNRIHQYMYFNADNFQFSVKLSTASFAELSASECERFLEDLRAFNGQYNVDGILYPKEKAVELIKQLYVKTNASFKLYTDLSKNDVVRIFFDRKKAAKKLSDCGTEP